MRVFPVDNEVATNVEYDVCIWGLGYEIRSTESAKSVQRQNSKKLAIGYRRNREVFAYRQNLIFLQSIGCEILEADDRDDIDDMRVYERFGDIVDSEYATRGRLKLLIDISVLNRARLSRLLWQALSLGEKIREIHIWYTQAEFEAPSKRIQPIRRLGPIFDTMVPFNGQLSLPLLLIAGIGYEPEKALGLTSEIDPDELIVLQPESEDPRYNLAVKENNQDLFDLLSTDGLLKYSVAKPFSCYYDLRALVRQKLNTRRVSFLPIGPKINVAVCILVAFEFLPSVTVWRASSLDEEVHLEKHPSGLPPVILGVSP